MKGYQGYVTSRPFQGNRVPQHVQNLVIRDYCHHRKMTYLLSGTEYAIPNSHLMLQLLLDEIEDLNGIVAYSLFQFPLETEKRLQIYDQVLTANRSLHFAVETLVLEKKEDVQRIEDIWGVHLTMQSLSNTPSLL